MEINPKKLTGFKRTVTDFYRKNMRDLPWRTTEDPYHILVSEVMLQQTQVPRVLVKYPLFIKRFPDFKTLSAGKVGDILTVWSGMGYNRRALYLQKIAQKVVADYGGILPSNPLTLDLFPGIGASTACSIAAFAYNKPTVFIETNIRRVFIHHFFQDREEVDDKEIYPLVALTVDTENPRDWYYALMDYGTYLAKNIVNPNRKSKHYTVQSQFEGSDRQIRGRILRMLLKKPLTEDEIIEETAKDEGRVRRILQDLAKDGFIRAKEDKYIID